MKTCNNDDEESAMAALECLNAIQTILQAISERPELYPPVEEVLLPLMKLTLSDEFADFFEDGVKIITFITFYSDTISPAMWSLIPLMHARFQACTEFMEDFLNPLDNYISRSTEHFLTGGPYLPMVSDMYNKILTNPAEKENTCIDACKLIEVVLLNCRGRLTNILSRTARSRWPVSRQQRETHSSVCSLELP